MSRGHGGLICHCPFFWSRAGGKSWCPTDQSHWSLLLDLSPRWPANTIMLFFFLIFRKSRTVIWRISNYRYQQIFCIQSHFRNKQFQEAEAQPLCCTEDISLITFQFEWLLEEGAVLWYRGHDTSKENTWQGTVTHTKKTRDSGPWHIQRKHVTGKPDGAGKRRASAVLSPFELQERWSDRTKSWRAE